jgi:hypothetical protein
VLLSTFLFMDRTRSRAECISWKSMSTQGDLATEHFVESIAGYYFLARVSANLKGRLSDTIKNLEF